MPLGWRDARADKRLLRDRHLFSAEAHQRLLALAPDYRSDLGDYGKEPIAMALVAKEISWFSRPRWYFGLPGDKSPLKEAAALVAAMKRKASNVVVPIIAVELTLSQRGCIQRFNGSCLFSAKASAMLAHS